MGRAELPSVIAEQKCLIEDLAQSNQEYKYKFERLKLGIEEPAGGPVDDASRGGVVEMERRKSLSGTLTRKLKRMKFAIAGTSLQDKESTRGLGSEEFNNATWPSPKAQSSTTGSLATPPNADTHNMFINTSVQGRTTRPPVQKRGLPTTEAPMAFGQEVLFKQLEHHSMLITNLLKEVDEAQYKITLQSRWRMRGGIEGLYEGEKRDLEKMWGLTALQSAVQRLDSLEGIGELPRVNGFAAPVASANDSPLLIEDFGTPRPFKEEPVAEGGLIGQVPITRNATATPRSASIDPSSTPLVQPVHEALPQFFGESSLADSNMPFRSLTLEIPSATPTVTQARKTRPALTSESANMRRAETAKAKAEEQRKSSTISRREDTGDRIGGNDTGEGGVDMTTPPETVVSSSRKRLSFVINAPLRSHQHSLRVNGAIPCPVDEGDTEELVGKRANGKGQIGRAERLRHAPALFQPVVEQGDSQLANEDLVNRLISLWTTVKP